MTMRSTSLQDLLLRVLTVSRVNRIGLPLTRVGVSASCLMRSRFLYGVLLGRTVMSHITMSRLVRSVRRSHSTATALATILRGAALKMRPSRRAIHVPLE